MLNRNQSLISAQQQRVSARKNCLPNARRISPSDKSKLLPMIFFLLLPTTFSHSAPTSFKEARWGPWETSKVTGPPEISQSTIIRVDRLASNRLWIATTDAILKYDGVTFQKYSPPWSESSAHALGNATGFMSGLDGDIFLFSQAEGTFVLRKGDTNFKPVLGNNEQRGGIVNLTIFSSLNKAAMITDQRVYVFDANDEQNHELAINIDYSKKYPVALLPGKKDQLLVVLSNGEIIRMIESETGFRSAGHFSCFEERMSFLESARVHENEVFLIESDGKLKVWNITDTDCAEDALPPAIKNALPRDYIARYVRYLSTSKILAVGTDSGTILFDGVRAQLIEKSNSALDSNQSMSIEELSKNYLWIGTFAGTYGALLSDRVTVDRLSGESKPWVVSISSDPEIGVFVATYDRIFKEHEALTGRRYEQLELPDSVSTISSIAASPKGLWIGQQRGQIHFLPNGEAEKACIVDVEAGGADDPITSIRTIGSGGGRVVASTLRGRVFFITECLRERQFDSQKGRPETTKLISIHAGNGFIWLIDLNGARRFSEYFNAGADDHSQVPHNIPEFIDGVWDVAESKTAFYMLEPQGSIVRIYKHAELGRPISEEIETISETAYAIEVDGRGRPWIASKSGVWLLENEEEFQIQVDTDDTSNVHLDYGASHRSHNDTLYFGGTGGLIVIPNPSNFPNRRQAHAPLVRMVRDDFALTVDSTYAGNGLTLSEAKIPLQFSLANNGFFPAPDSRYQFKLENFDAGWNSVESENQITYSNLPPGTYLFRARGAPTQAAWSGDEVVLPITVLAPIWHSWWSLIGLLTAALMLFSAWSRYHDRRVIEQDRLARARDAEAAIARYEDDYQEGLEANAHLLRSRADSAQKLIALLSTIVYAHHISNDRSNSAAQPITNSLQALRSAESIAIRTSYTETVNLCSLANEVCALAATKSKSDFQTIVINDVSNTDAPLTHSRYISVCMYEAIALMQGLPNDGEHIEPILTISLASPTPDKDNLFTYVLVVSDLRAPLLESTSVELALPATMHLIESLGGSLHVEFDRGNVLRIELPMPSNEAETK